MRKILEMAMDIDRASDVADDMTQEELRAALQLALETIAAEKVQFEFMCHCVAKIVEDNEDLVKEIERLRAEKREAV